MNDKFKLKRKEYSFYEVFKAYEEGKEIESLVTNCKYKNIDDIDCFKNDFTKEWVEVDDIVIDEIRGEWYINN